MMDRELHNLISDNYKQWKKDYPEKKCLLDTGINAKIEKVAEYEGWTIEICYTWGVPFHTDIGVLGEEAYVIPISKNCHKYHFQYSTDEHNPRFLDFEYLAWYYFNPHYNHCITLKEKTNTPLCLIIVNKQI